MLYKVFVCGDIALHPSSRIRRKTTAASLRSIPGDFERARPGAVSAQGPTASLPAEPSQGMLSCLGELTRPCPIVGFAPRRRLSPILHADNIKQTTAVHFFRQCQRARSCTVCQQKAVRCCLKVSLIHLCKTSRIALACGCSMRSKALQSLQTDTRPPSRSCPKHSSGA